MWGGPGAWDGDGNRNLCTDVNIWRHVRYKVLFSVPTHLFKYLFIVNCKIHCWELTLFFQVVVRVKLSRCPVTQSTIWENSWRSVRTILACWLLGRMVMSRRGSHHPCGPWITSTTWWTPWSSVFRRRSCRRDWGSLALTTEGEEAARGSTIVAMMKRGRRRRTCITGQRNNEKEWGTCSEVKKSHAHEHMDYT